MSRFPTDRCCMLRNLCSPRWFGKSRRQWAGPVPPPGAVPLDPARIVHERRSPRPCLERVQSLPTRMGWRARSIWTSISLSMGGARHKGAAAAKALRSLSAVLAPPCHATSAKASRACSTMRVQNTAEQLHGRPATADGSSCGEALVVHQGSLAHGYRASGVPRTRPRRAFSGLWRTKWRWAPCLLDTRISMPHQWT